MANVLQNYKILLVDADIQLGKILQSVLSRMGFSNVTVTPSGQEALELLKQKPFDFVISEWNTRHIDGIELLNQLRRTANSPNLTLPVIMLTGRAEHADVLTARDSGINEYVIKPFTAKTIFSRLERLIENPRNFILTKFFVGPDRRNKGVLPTGISERRGRPLNPLPKLASPAVDGTNKAWVADNSLKQKLGIGTTLASVITPQTLHSAQQAIESANAEALKWLQENITQLKDLQQVMAKGDLYTLLPIDMSETALMLSSRAGTLGYSGTSKVAYLMYLFCRNNLRMEEPAHHMVAAKHIDALKVTLMNPQRDATTTLDHEIVCELRNLVDKYAA